MASTQPEVEVKEIGFQDGIASSVAAFKLFDPDHDPAYDKLGSTLHTLKAGHNETLDRLAAIEARLRFPFAASSSPGGS